jgi:hypothetical protein
MFSSRFRSGMHRHLSLGLVGVSLVGLMASDAMPGPRLIANEYAHWNPNDPDAVRSRTWDMTSGSLFARDAVLWTGRPDGTSPGPRSEAGTDSAVFRLITRDRSFRNVRVAFDLRIDALVTTPRTPEEDWDGVHVFLRYESQYRLYYVSVSRRDGTTAIKKKEPGGPSNGGTYYTLASGDAPVGVVADWNAVAATAETLPSGSVRIALYRGDELLLEVIDDGTEGGPPITAPGAVGIRGDNCEFEFRDFTITDLEHPDVVVHLDPAAP